MTKTARRGRGSGKAIGRPRVTLADLDPRWREIMLNIYAEGGSEAEVQVALPSFPRVSSQLSDCGITPSVHPVDAVLRSVRQFSLQYLGSERVQPCPRFQSPIALD